jgi:hypothetical protein
VVQGDEEGIDEEDDNQHHDAEDMEIVTNKNLYLIEAMHKKKNNDFVEFSLCK